MNIRTTIKEAFALDPARIQIDKNFFSKVPDKTSNLGCLEFKYSHDNKEVDAVVKEMTPYLHDLGVKFISTIKLTNIVVITCTKENSEEIQKICKKFGFMLAKETFSDAPKNTNNVLDNGQQNVPQNAKSTDYGRSSHDGRANFSSGSMLTGMPVDRLAGE